MKMTLIIIGVVLAVIVGTGVTSYVTNYNYGNEAERTIEAEYENLSNVLGQYSLKIKEAAQIPAMQTEDLATLFTGALDARYGAGGSQAAMQWIQEQNPQLDQATYLKIQQMIEAGRNKFENHQTKFLDTKRVYETNLGYLWTGTWLRIAGYPKIDLDEMNIVTSTHAKQALETGVDEGMNLR
jgi:hypothetical protein